MELEEMQAVWSQMSDQIEKQKKLTDKMIIMMTQEQYRKKLNKIAYPEIIGAVICYSVAILILFNLEKLDNWYSLVSGLISVVALLVLPVLSLKWISKMRNINISGNSYKETLIEYTKGKQRFKKSMRLGYYLGFVLMFVIMPVSSKIIKGKDLFTETKSIWPIVIAIPLAIIFFFVFTKWVYKSYTGSMNSAEVLIKELEEKE